MWLLCTKHCAKHITCVCACTQWHLTLCDPMDCSLPGSSVHGVFQVRLPEQFTISYSKASYPLRDRTHVSCVSYVSRQTLYHCATWEALSILHMIYYFIDTILWNGDLPSGSAVRNLYAVQETRVQSLGWEDPLKKEMTIHSSNLAWKISWTEEPGGQQSLLLWFSHSVTSNSFATPWTM